MLRRRGLYLLGLLVEQPASPNNDNNINYTNNNWQKYVLCFQALEMETEPHLIEQVWETVAHVVVVVL